MDNFEEKKLNISILVRIIEQLQLEFEEKCQFTIEVM